MPLSIICRCALYFFSSVCRSAHVFNCLMMCAPSSGHCRSFGHDFSASVAMAWGVFPVKVAHCWNWAMVSGSARFICMVFFLVFMLLDSYRESAGI